MSRNRNRLAVVEAEQAEAEQAEAEQAEPEQAEAEQAEPEQAEAEQAEAEQAEADPTSVAILAILAAVDLAQQDDGSASLATIAPAVSALRPLKSKAGTLLAETLAAAQMVALSGGDLARIGAIIAVQSAVSAALSTTAPKVSTARTVDPIGPAVTAWHRVHAMTLAADGLAAERERIMATLTDDQRDAVRDRFSAELPAADADPLVVLAYVSQYGPTARRGAKASAGTAQGGTGERTVHGRKLADVPDGPVTYRHDGNDHTAEVAAGSIVLDDGGQSFDSPTAAARAVNGGVSVNGWAVWQRDGKTLAALIDG